VTSLVDQAARTTALDPARSFIVQAPAGAGKTELLTQRLLVLLTQVQQPQEIVAITFTRKAAGEMRQRVLKALREGLGEKPQQAHAQKTWALARAVLEHDAERGWALLKDPSQLWVTTFDSLNQSLVQRMPVRSLLGGDIAITESPEPIYREAARAVLQSISHAQDESAAVSVLMSMLDNQFSRAEDLLVEMLMRRDHWLGRMLDNQGWLSGEEGRAYLEQTLQRLIVDQIQQVAELFASGAETWLTLLRKTMQQRVETYGEGADPNGLRFWQTLPRADAESVEQWRMFMQWLLTQDGGLRKRWSIQEGVLSPSEAKGPGSAEEKARRKAFKDALLDQVQTMAMHESLLQEIRGLPPARLRETQWQQIQALLVMLNDAVLELLSRFAARGEADFSELARRARAALGHEDAPTDLALNLDARIQHVLVDEFQDTSQGQFQFLQRLIAGWAQDPVGRSLFLVGDPMQSIYRFRDAEVSLFMEVQKQQALNGFALQPLQLQMNFRSRPELVDWNNHCFETAFPQAEMFVGAVPYAASASARPPAASEETAVGVCLHAIPRVEQSKRLEAERVLQLISDALQHPTHQRIAILVRGRSHLVEIVRQLRVAEIPYRAVELEALAERATVRDLEALTRALLHPAEQEAWLAVLRAPYCGLSLVDLQVLFDGLAKDAHVPQALTERIERMSLDGKQRAQHMLTQWQRAMRLRGQLPLRDWVERIWLALGGAAVVQDAAAMEDAQAYFGLLEQEQQQGDIHDFSALRARLKDLHARSPGEARVQIMTMHKAKGLEFDVVILPALERKAPADRERLLEWLEIPRADGEGVDPLLVPKRAVGAENDSLYTFARTINQTRARNEQLRLLYVACTRAREQLHLLATIDEEKAPPSTSLLARLWSVLGEAWRAQLPVNQASEQGSEVLIPIAKAPAPELLRVHEVSADWLGVLPSDLLGMPRMQAPPLEFAWASRAAAHIGTVTHALLEQVSRQHGAALDKVSLGDWQDWVRRRLQQAGVPQATLNVAQDRVLRAAQTALAEERGQWILCRHEDDRWEWALSGWVTDSATDAAAQRLVQGTLDRSFVDQGVRWIIDYKTASHEGADRAHFLDEEQARYRDQLEAYARLVQQWDRAAGRELPIRLGLYFPLMQGWRSWAMPASQESGA
jgi:ATP-dependent helicase/nuclease subunit A